MQVIGTAAVVSGHKIKAPQSPQGGWLESWQTNIKHTNYKSIDISSEQDARHSIHRPSFIREQTL